MDGNLNDVPGYVGITTKPDIVCDGSFLLLWEKKLCIALLNLDKFNVITKVDKPPNGYDQTERRFEICINPNNLSSFISISRCDDIFAELHDKKCFIVISLKTGFLAIQFGWKIIIPDNIQLTLELLLLETTLHRHFQCTRNLYKCYA